MFLVALKFKRAGESAILKILNVFAGQIARARLSTTRWSPGILWI
jgi:hypothetical protein